MPLRSIAFLAYFFTSSAATLAVPMIGVMCYLVLYHVYPQTTWWGQRIEFLGIRYSFVCGVCLLIGCALNVTRLPFGRRFMHPIEWGILLMFLLMLLSTATGTPWDARTEWVLDKISKVFVFIFLFTHVVVTRQYLWQITLLFAVLTLYLGYQAHGAPPSAFAQNRLNGIGGPDFRESAGLAIHLFALMPFVGILLRERSMWLKVLAFFAACYGMNAIVLCRARSAFLAGITAGLLAIVYIPRRHRRWLLTMLALAVVGGLILADTWFWERMVTIFHSGEQRDQSAASRFEVWAAAWELIRTNPLGVGIGHFEQQIGFYSENPELRFRDAHNSFVLCAAEVGLAGLLVYVGTLAAAWLTLGSLARRVRRELESDRLFEMLIFANRLALIVYLVGGMTTSRFYTEGAWILIALPVCISRAVENEVRARAKVTAPAAPPEWRIPAGLSPLPQGAPA